MSPFPYGRGLGVRFFRVRVTSLSTIPRGADISLSALQSRGASLSSGELFDDGSRTTGMDHRRRLVRHAAPGVRLRLQHRRSVLPASAETLRMETRATLDLARRRAAALRWSERAAYRMATRSRRGASRDGRRRYH